MRAPVIVAEVVRSGFAESRHRGSVVALAGDGTVAFALGDVETPVFPRSTNKPMQAVAMVRSGLDLDGEQLALAAASHSGQEPHLDGVRKILAGAGLTEQALQTPPDLPLDEGERTAWIRAGRPAEPVGMNCSGKHAAMLACCVARGWPTATYRDPGHPLQVLAKETLEELAGEPVAATGIDGCGAPLFAVSLTGLACAFRAIVTAPPGTPERRVADAMRAHPELVGGDGRVVTRLMRGVPGLLAKDGAEAVFAAALPDGRAVALKIDDGGQRAVAPVLVAALRRLGVSAPVLDELAEAPVYGAGRSVGAVRATDY